MDINYKKLPYSVNVLNFNGKRCLQLASPPTHISMCKVLLWHLANPHVIPIELPSIF